jgi:diphthamide synthase subunit DPH2
MGFVKSNQIHQSDILRLEAELNNLWGELNTCNIPHAMRLDMESKLAGCEEQFKAVLGGTASFSDLQTNLETCDKALAFAAIQQAEHELSKTELESSRFLALENIRKELSEGNITSVKARHEIKSVMRNIH